MIFNLPKEKDRALLYELYYMHGICFAALMPPKERKNEILSVRQTGRKNVPFAGQRVNKTPAFIKVRKTEVHPFVVCKVGQKESFQWTRVPAQRGGKISANRSVLNRQCNQY